MRTLVTKANGQIQGIDAVHKWIDNVLSFASNGTYSLVLSRDIKKRSLEQNRLMWMWFSCIADETGTPVNDVHDYYCKQFLSRDFVNPSTGEITKINSGTRDLNTAEFTRFLDSVKADAATEFGINLPLPSDICFEAFELQYGRYAR